MYRSFHVCFVYFKLGVSKYFFWKMVLVFMWVGDHTTMEGASLGCLFTEGCPLATVDDGGALAFR